MAEVKHHAGVRFTGTAAERGALATALLPPGTEFIESDTNNIWQWDGVAWKRLDGAGGGTVIGAGALPQVAYWTAGNTIAGDAGFTYNAATDTITLAGGVVLTGGAASVLTVNDNIANALTIVDAGALEYLRIISDNVQPIVRFNDGGVDIDHYVEAVGVADALFIRGADGQVTLGVLGAGVVQSTAGGVLSSAAVPLVDLAGYAQGSIIRGGAVDWEAYVHPGAAGYAFTTTATDIVWDQTPLWTSTHSWTPAVAATTPILDLNPANVGTAEIINITPSAALTTLGAKWDGIVIDGSALDPAPGATDVHIHGIHVNHSGILTTRLPHIDALHMETPTDYHREFNHALHTEGGGIWMDWSATTITTVDTFTTLNVVIDVGVAVAGDIHALDVALAGTGTVPNFALGTHSGVGVIHQHVGAFAATNKAWEWEAGPIWTDQTAAFGNPAVDVEIFSADDDLIYISGAAAGTTFDEIQVILDTPASVSIKPVFEYSVAGPGWTQFYPADDTQGFSQNGTIRFEAANLVGWAQIDVNAEGVNRYWIRITRTRNNLVTPPIEDTIMVLDATAYGWDSAGAVNIASLTLPVLTFNGATGANVITVPDNLADALHVIDAGGADDYLTVVSTDAQRELVVNQDSVDIDFRIEASGMTHALFVRGSDGQIGINNTAPNEMLDIQRVDGADVAIRLHSNNAAGDPFHQFVTNVTDWYFGVDNDDADKFMIGSHWVVGTNAWITIQTDSKVGIHNTAPAAQLHVDQSSATGAQPVLVMDQADVDYVLVKVIATSNAGDANYTLVDDADFGTPGALLGWMQWEIDDQRVGGLGNIDVWVPFHAIPT